MSGDTVVEENFKQKGKNLLHVCLLLLSAVVEKKLN